MNNTYRWCMDNFEVDYTTFSASSSPKASNFENLSLGCGEIDLFSVAGESDVPLNPLADLSGDYDCQIRNLLYGQLCNGVHLSAPSSSPPPLPSRIQNKQWDTVWRPMPLLRSSQFSQMNSNTMFLGPFTGYGIDTALLVTAAFCSEGKQKARGTGTYFPNMNGSSRVKPSHGRGKSKQLRSCNQFRRHNCSNGNVLSSSSWKSNSYENGTHEFLPASSRFQGQGKSDVCCQSPPRSVKDDNHTNGFESALFKIEFGSLGSLAEEVVSGLSCAWDSTLGISTGGQDSTAVMKQERVTERSLHLKNEDEFPALCQ